MYIFNRWGNKVFEKDHYGNLNFWGSDQDAWWWGYSQNPLDIGGGKVPPGNYLYVFEDGYGKTYTGTVMVLLTRSRSLPTPASKK